MVQKMKEKNKSSKKGFTLVEVIVVLVILAILMAIAIPSVTRYINKAKEKEGQLNARSVYLAACVVLGEELETKDTVDTIDTAKVAELANLSTNGMVITLTDDKQAIKSVTYGSYTYDETGKITKKST